MNEMKFSLMELDYSEIEIRLLAFSAAQSELALAATQSEVECTGQNCQLCKSFPKHPKQQNRHPIQMLYGNVVTNTPKLKAQKKPKKKPHLVSVPDQFLSRWEKRQARRRR